MRIGIYGGTFDPVHLGHLILAETCRVQLQLDEVRFIPAAIPPHKQLSTISTSRDRVRMLEFAIAGHAQFRIDDLELRRKGVSYTVETLRELRIIQPQAELFLLMGADSLTDFPAWREPAAILELATLVAVNRGRTQQDLAPVQHKLGDDALKRILQVEMPGIDLSASTIRESIRNGTSIRYQVPRPVELYIDQNRLYRSE